MEEEKTRTNGKEQGRKRKGNCSLKKGEGNKEERGRKRKEQEYGYWK